MTALTPILASIAVMSTQIPAQPQPAHWPLGPAAAGTPRVNVSTYAAILTEHDSPRTGLADLKTVKTKIYMPIEKQPELTAMETALISAGLVSFSLSMLLTVRMCWSRIDTDHRLTAAEKEV